MKRTMHFIYIIAAAHMATGNIAAAAGKARGKTVIISPGDASFMETLAAREVRRYVYLRTGELLPIVETAPESGQSILVARKGSAIFESVQVSGPVDAILAGLAPQQYLLSTGRRRSFLIIGGDELGALYGAYRFAEYLGVRFYMHGDVVPDDRIPLELPADLTEMDAPLFDLRGIQPFHDFPEGPDWWNIDDYKAVLSQLPKLRMNFFALHTYPEKHPNAEPTVWIGTPDDVAGGGRVKFSYPASYQNTLRGNWGYQKKKTSDFSLGAAQLFERDAFGADVMRDLCPQPDKPEDCNEVFHRAGDLLREAFVHAHALGIKTCVGTETPLTVPERVKARLKDKGKASTDPAVIRELYEGMFRRIMDTYPIDYYWFWTPEGWTWQGTSEKQIQATVDDMKAAIAAAKNVDTPFTLATCGWVLGPQNDRALFDNLLPKDMPMSCINRQVGKTPVDEGFARVKGRPKWAIPWLEDDPGLTEAQLWVGRMRRDAADALRYGCTGLMGIHWRTRILGPNVLALAHAAWEQDPWSRDQAEPARPKKVDGPIGGKHAAFPNSTITDTEEDTLYQTVRYDVSAYHLRVPNGTYNVTLKFCEPHYKEANKRVFDVALEGKRVVDKLDIFARVGQNRALDFACKDVKVEDGRIDVTFAKRVEFPSIAAIAIEGENFSRKINCGGPKYKDYEADPPPAEPQPRFSPTGDFYRDWALSQFGSDVAEPVADIFIRMDAKLPRPTEWIHGPGGLVANKKPWAEVEKTYAFLDELAALGSKVKGAGNRERFDYWIGNFRYMKAASRTGCLWGQYSAAQKRMDEEKDPAAKKKIARETLLPLRKQLVRQFREVYNHLLPTVTNMGELGTVANWEQHIMPPVLTQPGEKLAKILGEPLPADAQLEKVYNGPPHIIVPTVRTSVAQGESLSLKVIVLDKAPPRETTLYWREMGQGEYTEIVLAKVDRGVYSVALPAKAAKATGLEYYIEVATSTGKTLRFPATAPRMSQTVVVTPPVK